MAWNPATGRFPSLASGLSMSQLLTGFNLQPGATPLTYPFHLSSLVGKFYWTVVGTGVSVVITPQTVALPVRISDFSLAFFLNPTPIINLSVTTTPISLPVNTPIPTGISFQLIAGGGGGGSGGGGNIAYGGGDGGGGGGAGTLTTGFVSYDPTAFSSLQITFPSGGAAGTGGEGAGGSPGTSAILTYNSYTYTALFGTGGGGGGAGGLGSQGGQGTAGTGGGFTIVPAQPNASGLNGSNAVNATPGSPGGGAGGGGGFPLLVGGNGTAGAAGSVTISWYFT